MSLFVLLFLLASFGVCCFALGAICGILKEAKAQERCRQIEAAKRRRNGVYKNLPFLLVLLFLPSAGLASPRPKPQPRPDPAEAALQLQLQRFPSRAVCQVYLNLADSHLEYLRCQLILHPRQRIDICEYSEQVTYWREVWRKLEYAQAGADAYSIQWRRQCLGEVREAIGEQAYWIGYVPSPVAAHWLMMGD